MDTTLERDVQHVRLVELAPFRARLYAWLTAAFGRAPEAQDLELIATDTFLDAIEAFGEGASGALRACAASHRASEQWLAEARQEFMNLFKVPGRQYVPPYESVYRDSREIEGKQVAGLLMGACAIAVRKWYQLAALDISEKCKELPDHIALELAYLAHICQKEQEFAATGDVARLTRAWEMERDFLSTHVVSWVMTFRDKIHENTEHPYFRGVSDLAVAFTRYDLDALESVAGPAQDAPWVK